MATCRRGNASCKANDRNATCGLSWMSRDLHLFCMAPTTDVVLMGHFLAHYAELGVDVSAHAYIVLHVVDGESLRDMKVLLDQFRVRPALEVGYYTSMVKVDLVNKWLAELPIGSWAIHADSDEFFQFKCNVQGYILNGKNHFVGIMTEHVGADYTFPELKTFPQISEQYPIACPGLREGAANALGFGSKIQNYKVILFKVHIHNKTRSFINNHHVTFVSRKVTKKIGRFPHFTMTGTSSLLKTKYKMEAYSVDDFRSSLYRFYFNLFENASSSSCDGLQLSAVGHQLFVDFCRCSGRLVA